MRIPTMPTGPRAISLPDQSGNVWMQGPGGGKYQQTPQGQQTSLAGMISTPIPGWRGPVGSPGGEPPEETSRIRPPVGPGGMPGFGTWNAAGPMGDTPSIYAPQPGAPGPSSNPPYSPYAPSGSAPVGGGVQTPVFNGPQGGGPPPAVAPPGAPQGPVGPQPYGPGHPTWERYFGPGGMYEGKHPSQQQAPAQQSTPPGYANINTSITPQNIYSPQQTQEQINTTKAIAAQNANLPWLLRQFARPGVSQRSPSALGQAIPQIAQAQSAIGRAPTEIGFADDAANMDHFRSGQVSREQEAQGMAGGLLRMQDIGRVLQGTQGNILAQLLGRFA